MVKTKAWKEGPVGFSISGQTLERATGFVREAGSPVSSAELMQFRLCMLHFVDMAERVVAGHEPVRGTTPVLGNRVGQGVVIEEPAGVAGLITAFNFPFHLALMKLGPALGAGCTTVLKPSELTPLVGLMFGKLATDADLPPGVLNVVAGGIESGLDPLVASPAIRRGLPRDVDRVRAELLRQTRQGLLGPSAQDGERAFELLVQRAE